MREKALAFLQDIVQGVYGKADLSYKDVADFMELANDDQLNEVKEFYWKLSDIDEDDKIQAVEDLVQLIKEGY